MKDLSVANSSPSSSGTLSCRRADAGNTEPMKRFRRAGGSACVSQPRTPELCSRF